LLGIENAPKSALIGRLRHGVVSSPLLPCGLKVPDSRAPKTPIRVLVVDDEVNLRFAIEKGIRAAGHEPEAASTVRQAIDRLRDQSFDIVVCDLRMPGGDGRQLIQWLGSHSPSTRIIVVSAFVTPDFRQQFDPSTGLRIVEKPVEMPDLLKMIEEIGARRGFYGAAIEIELFDYVQMIALSGRDKLIRVRTPSGEGIIWFEHGDMVHCQYEQHKGEPAFYKLLAVGRGGFREEFYRDPPTRTIMQSSTHLLMEAARQMDEGTLGQDAGAPAAPIDDDSSFAGLAEDVEAAVLGGAPSAAESAGDLLLPSDDDDDEALPTADRPEAASAMPTPETSSQAMSLLDDPETRALMLGQFFEFDGVNGVAIVSSTGKVLAEDMRGNAALVTLAGFYMRGAARIARALGYNVFDGVLARAATGQQLLMVGMGATSAVLSVEIGSDAAQIRDEILGVDA
jgi:CheY-like chemotaxis protein